MKKNYYNSGYFYALLSAVLFGASTPITKYLLTSVNPWLLAGLLYLGSGIGLGIFLGLRYFWQKDIVKQTHFKMQEWGWLLAQIILGGIAAPLFLMFGLVTTNAATASLLLNLEGVFAVLIAWIIFKEHTDRRLMLGVVFIVIAGVILTWTPGLQIADLKGPLLIAAAGLAWGFDNNFSRKISASDPIKIVTIKSLVAGGVNTALALVMKTHLQMYPALFLLSGVVGFISYGLSLICFFLALRNIGTARTSAFFSLAPFVGVFFSVLFLHETLSWQIIIAALFMLIGIIIHLTEYHEHEHHHEYMRHTHSHTHDEHHQHVHDATHSPGEPHTHEHEHLPLTHTHPHYPDIHHLH